MRIVRPTLIAVLCALLSVPTTAGAQSASTTPSQHVADQATLGAALAARARQDQADRQTVARVLARDEVKQVAARAGIDLKRAEAAVATLEGAELQQVVAQARQAEQALSGGATTVVITTTTIILILLVVILLIMVAD